MVSFLADIGLIRFWPSEGVNVLQEFSVTVQRNDMRFGGIVAPKSGSLSLTLGPRSSFSFGVVSVLLSRFGSLFECTADKNL